MVKKISDSYNIFMYFAIEESKMCMMRPTGAYIMPLLALV